MLLVLEAVVDDKGRLVNVQVRRGLRRTLVLLSESAIDQSLVALVLNYAQVLLRQSADAIGMIDILVLSGAGGRSTRWHTIRVLLNTWRSFSTARFPAGAAL